MGVVLHGVPVVCPQCRGQLVSEPDAYACRPCSRRYPVVLGIPDFRLFPDPYLSVEEDYRKGAALLEQSARSFPELVARYWEMTPGVPQDLVGEYVRSAVTGVPRARQTWSTIDAALTPEKGSLLEVGCGTAGFLAAVGPAFATRVGLDIAFRWLVVARRRLEEAGLGKVLLVCGCAEHLPFPAGAFDAVVAEDVLDHTRDPGAFLRESARVLRPRKGVFYLSTPNRYSLGPDPHVWVWGVGFLPPRFRDAYVRWRKGIPYGPIRPVSYFELRRLLGGAGFRRARVMLPQVHGVQHRTLPRWQRVALALYEVVRRLPILRGGLRLIGPTFHVLSRG